jgi:hypothetical protein
MCGRDPGRPRPGLRAKLPGPSQRSESSALIATAHFSRKSPVSEAPTAAAEIFEQYAGMDAFLYPGEFEMRHAALAV